MFAMIDPIPDQLCLVLAHPDPVYAAVTSRAFTHLGWTVSLARSGAEARQLTRTLPAQMVVLDAQLPGESGYLTCAKLHLELPQVKLVLVGSHPTPRDQDFAAFVHATLVSRHDGAAPLVRLANDLTAVAV